MASTIEVKTSAEVDFLQNVDLDFFEFQRPSSVGLATACSEIRWQQL
jgi:hypothetical protein